MHGFDFTDEEWREIRLTPWMVAGLVIDAGPGGPISERRELNAVMRDLDTAALTTDHRPLVRAIAADLVADSSRDSLRAVNHRDEWANRLREILDLVHEKAPAADEADFREWLYEIATDVAEASHDELRFRGPRVSENERQVLDALDEILQPSG